MGEIGSFRNMLRRWRLNLKRKKKIQKHHKIKQIAWNAFALIYSPVAIIFHNLKKDEVIKKENPSLYKKIENINQDIKNIVQKRTIQKKKQSIKKIQASIKTVKKEIQMMEKKQVKKSSSVSKSIPYFKKQVAILEDNVKQVIPSKIEAKKGTIVPIEIPQKTIKENSVKPKLESTSNQVHNMEEVNTFPPNNPSSTFAFKPYIQEKEETLRELSEKIKTATVYEWLYEINEMILEVEIESKQIYAIHKNDFLTTNSFENSFNSLFSQIETDKKQLEEKRKQIFYRKEQMKKQVKKEKQVKEKIQVQIDEIMLAKQIMITNLANNSRYLQKLQKEMIKSTNKKRTLLFRLKMFSYQTWQFLFRKPLLQDKLLSSVVMNMMLNNYIKTMRQMVNPQYHAFYSMISGELQSDLEKLTAVYNTCDNSLQELANLQEEIKATFSFTPEVEKLLAQNEQIYFQISQTKKNIEEQWIIHFKTLIKKF